jgi:hypothetical protein
MPVGSVRVRIRSHPHVQCALCMSAHASVADPYVRRSAMRRSRRQGGAPPLPVGALAYVHFRFWCVMSRGQGEVRLLAFLEPLEQLVRVMTPYSSFR